MWIKFQFDLFQWMEKSENGCVFRNSSQEQKAAKKYNEQKQTRMEILYAKIQKELENSPQPQGMRQIDFCHLDNNNDNYDNLFI